MSFVRTSLLLAVFGALLVASLPLVSAAEARCFFHGDPGCEGWIPKECQDPDACAVGVITPNAETRSLTLGAGGVHVAATAEA